ncbi:MAG: hypothetical protein RLZZ147_416 [Actinomycetota bacterium]
MLKYLIVFLIIVDIYTLVDCAITPQEKVRRFPKWAWLLIIVLTGIFGDIAWFIAGGRIIPPDDNPDFLRKL